MKTKKLLMVLCSPENPSLPITKTSLVTDGGKPVHLQGVRISRFNNERRALLEIGFLEEHTPFIGEKVRHYHSAIKEGPDSVTPRVSAVLTELGMTPSGRNGNLSFTFAIDPKKQFSQHAFELLMQISKIFGFGDEWQRRTTQSQVTYVFCKDGWYEYFQFLLLKNGVSNIPTEQSNRYRFV